MCPRRFDPGDIDLVVLLDGTEVDALDPIRETTLHALVAGKTTQAMWRCDSYPLVEYSSGPIPASPADPTKELSQNLAAPRAQA